MRFVHCPNPALLKNGVRWRRLRWIAFFLVFATVHLLGLRNIVLLSRDVLYGDLSANGLVPAPRYFILRFPPNATTIESGAANRVGADFAQIYFPARNVRALDSAYNDFDNPDPLTRAPRYAPLMIYLCSESLCTLPYGAAVFWHMAIQIACFFVVVYIVFTSLNIREYLLPAFLFIDFCVFLTPAGLSFLERGQFSLYVANSYLLLLLGLFRKNKTWIVLAGVFAFMKWTSLAFFFVALALYTLGAARQDHRRFGSLAVLLVASVFAILSFPFVKETSHFIQGLMHQELEAMGRGLTLALFLPRYAVKAIPFVLVALGCLVSRWCKGDFVRMVPFLVGAAWLLFVYPSFAYEYGIPAILGLLPAMIIWLRWAAAAHQWAGGVVLYSFVLFTVAASFSQHWLVDRIALLVAYSIYATLLMGTPIIITRVLE